MIVWRSVDAAAHTVETVTGEQLSYDVLLVASGARPISRSRGDDRVHGLADRPGRLHGLVQDIEGGYVTRSHSSSRPAARGRCRSTSSR